MLEQFKNQIENKFSFLKESKLLVAISGGIDSVVLTHLCHQLDLNIALAHCNFNLRGKESDADEEFVLQLAENLDLEVFIENFDTENFAKDNKLSIQMAARELRYSWFEELSEQLGFDYILTAHHADDNLETFLINLSRGTGLEGLTGIPAVNNKLARPLLPFSREVIEIYAKAKKLKWREDSSNASTKYLRNKLRHDVIPILKEVNPQLLQNFQNTLNNLNGSTNIIAESIDGFLNKAIESMDKNEVKFKISELKKLKNPRPYLYETFKEFGFTQWDDILNLLDAETGKYVFSPTYRLIKNREHLLLSEINRDKSEPISISEKDKKIETSFGVLFFDEADSILEKQNNSIYVDKDKLNFPLTVRKREEGDVFYPLGMHGKKKLSKYFKDEKLSLLDKENVWLLCSGDDIVWVINKRADNRFKVTENTKHILKIILK
ncbi:tRNA lysidine(34) synthetase TilS [Wocania ichthyoenteri]|uniref:tRNA lysidine(34) synthetase TilS n=1 Tax=Wocania ichthyoenteri TaxID=1230531 RepID=UPI00053D76B9|nr:tRNA lysidine(34) synthetase TilS [Wocania ichthyoenteri]